MTLPFTAMPHRSVLLDEVIAALAPKPGGVYVDGTFGAGGYTRALLEAGAGHVYGIDRDPTALELGEAMVQRHAGRLTLIEGCFGDLDMLLEERGIVSVDGVALDLGVSSMQLDRAERGFSFRLDGPLDMRMAGIFGGPSAADVVNGASETELSDLIWRLGEERHARRIARAIVEARAAAPITRTVRLADIVGNALGPRARAEKIHPATRTFQALRLHVNDELGELERGLAAAERVLKPGGHLAVVAFHSLEDRAVKGFLAARAGTRGGPSRHQPATGQRPPSFRLLFNGAQKPTGEEVALNPRARSARLRAAERTDAPIWSEPERGPR